MPETGYFHLHLVSDATGETLITVARAAAAQYANVSPVEHLYPMVRSKKQLDHALAEISESPGLVLYTLLEEDLIQSLEKKCRELGLPCMSVLVPGVMVASAVENLTRPLVVGLYASPERIVQIRENRLLGLRAHRDDDQYIDKMAVAEEVSFSRRLCARRNWPTIDVTRRSIEETAAAVMRLLSERRRHPVA